MGELWESEEDDMSFRLGEEVIVSVGRKVKEKMRKKKEKDLSEKEVFFFLFIEKGRRECFERKVGEVE